MSKYLSFEYMQLEEGKYCHDAACYSTCKVEPICSDISKVGRDRLIEKFLYLILSELEEVQDGI